MTRGVVSEDCFSVNVWTAAKSAKERRPVFLYLWDHPMPGPDVARFGAFHTSEVPYVLNTFHMSDRPFTETDHKIAEMMSSFYLRAFGEGSQMSLPDSPQERAVSRQ